MSFDALTLVGILASLLSGGFLIALVSRNDPVEELAARPARPPGPRTVIPGTFIEP